MTPAPGTTTTRDDRRGLRTLAALVLAAACAAAAGAQTPGDYHDERGLPEGPVGARIQELLDAVSSGEPARARALVETAFAPGFRDAFPIEQHLGQLTEMHRRSQGFELYGLRRYDEPRPVRPGPRGGPPGSEEGEEQVVIVRNRLTGAWEAFVLVLEPEPPHRIASLRLAPARPPHGLPAPGALTREELVEELQGFVDRLAAADVFSGTVLLAGPDGEVLLQGAWGEASRRYGVPNRIDTRFNLGSMNKMFTAVAVLQLVERGKLALDDPLSDYVGEDWLPKEVTGKIRIEHLLTHTSGLGSYFNEAFFRSSRELFRELEDYRPLFEGETLAFEPGTDWRYSNTGMFLLGLVIEKASGTGYFDSIREHVYRPAGMTGSDSYDMDRPVPNLAMGHAREGGEWVENTFKHTIRGGPAGGGFSTAPDLLAFARALRAGKLVSPETAARLWSPKPELSSPDYGYGFGIGGTPEDRIVGHSGGFPGISSNLDLFLDSGFTAVVLSNVDGGSQPVAEKIRELVGRLGTGR
jgi:CubicO group peptidase (beta-lactamase class C family)